MLRDLTRRRFLAAVGLTAGTLGMLAACTPAASPTAAPVKPAAQPTAAPKAAATSAPAAKPTAAPAKPAAAATQAPAKQTYQKVSVKGITIEGFPDNMWWRMGKAKGIFDEYGIDIDVAGVNGGPQVISAVVSGEVDYADQSPSTMLTIAAKDFSIKSIGGSRPGLTYVVVVQKNINSFEDLAGKSMGIGAAKALLDQISRYMLKKHNVDADTMNFASVGSASAIYKAVVAGKIDAGLSEVAAIGSAEKDGVKILADVWKEIPGFLRGAFWATNKTIAAKPDVLARLLAAYAKSYRFAASPESKDLFMKVAKEDFGVSDEMAQFQRDFTLKNPDTIARNLELPEQGIKLAQELNVSVGNQPAVVPFTQVADLSIQKKALELVGKV